MQKSYSRINWENYPSDATPINETNLNKIDYSLNEVDNRVIEHETTKATKEEVAVLVADVSFEESTGIITVTKKNGAVITIDTKMEKIAVNFDYDPVTQHIILTLIDGTKQYIDLSALITQYEFLNSDTVTFIVQPDGTVKAEVLDGSITEDKLQPNFLADVTVQADIAKRNAEEATNQKDLATMEADRAKTEADKAAQYSSIVAPDFYVDIETMTLYQKAGVGVSFIADENNILYWKIA